MCLDAKPLRTLPCGHAFCTDCMLYEFRARTGALRPLAWCEVKLIYDVMLRIEFILFTLIIQQLVINNTA